MNREKVRVAFFLFDRSTVLMITSASSFDELQTEIAGHRIAELVRRFGTPLCVYDFALMLDRIASLSVFDVVRYSASVSSTTDMLKRLLSTGVSLSVSNAIEIRRGLAAGFSAQLNRKVTNGQSMIYAGNLLDRESLDLVVELGLHANCGSPDMIDQIGQRRPGADVTLGINPFFGHANGKSDRFMSQDAMTGIGLEQIEECLFKADQYGITVTGVELQLKNGIEVQELEHACEVLMAAVSMVGRTITTIGIAGGLPFSNASKKSLQLASEFQESLNATRLRIHDSVGHTIKFELTVGDALYSGTRSLIAEVRAVKKFGDLRCYVVDGEVDDFLPLAGSITEGLIAVCPRDGAMHERPFVDTFLCGPLNPTYRDSCVSEVKHRRLPIAVVGDFVMVQDPIAETASKSSDSRMGRRTEIILKNGEADILRKRDTYDD